jgi:hypothetical protein
MSDDAINRDWREGATRDYLEQRRAKVDRRMGLVEQVDHLKVEIDHVDEEIAELDRAAIVFGIQPPAVAPKPAPAPTGRQGGLQFKDVALKYLRDAYPKAVTAASLQAFCQDVLGREFHPKTSGMTLYRFSQAGLAERIGKSDWKYIPQEGEGPEASTSEPSIFD